MDLLLRGELKAPRRSAQAARSRVVPPRSPQRPPSSAARSLRASHRSLRSLGPVLTSPAFGDRVRGAAAHESAAGKAGCAACPFHSHPTPHPSPAHTPPQPIRSQTALAHPSHGFTPPPPLWFRPSGRLCRPQFAWRQRRHARSASARHRSRMADRYRKGISSISKRYSNRFERAGAFRCSRFRRHRR